MSASGPKQTSLIAPHMSAFGGKGGISNQSVSSKPRGYGAEMAEGTLMTPTKPLTEPETYRAIRDALRELLDFDWDAEPQRYTRVFS